MYKEIQINSKYNQANKKDYVKASINNTCKATGKLIVFLFEGLSSVHAIFLRKLVTHINTKKNLQNKKKCFKNPKYNQAEHIFIYLVNF